MDGFILSRYRFSYSFSIAYNDLTSVLSIFLSHHKWQTLDEDVEDSDEGAVVTVAGVVGGVVAALARTRRRTGTYSLIGSSRN